MKYLISLGILLLVSCGQQKADFKYTNVLTPPPPPIPAIDLLQGTWQACGTDGSTSTQVRFTFANNLLNERISQWDQPGCVGNETVHLEFTANVVVESAEGASIYHQGATDIRFHPDVDLFGCGASNPAYTFIKFTDHNFNQFNPSLTEPSCDPSTRGFDINPNILFIKQHFAY